MRSAARDSTVVWHASGRVARLGDRRPPPEPPVEDPAGEPPEVLAGSVTPGQDLSGDLVRALRNPPGRARWPRLASREPRVNTTFRPMVPTWHLQCYMDLPHRLIIVRRDHAAILAAILHNPDRWPPGSAVMADRRAPERRGPLPPGSTDRPPRERRTPPDTIWVTQGFTVVHVAHLPAGAIRLDDVAATADRTA